MTAKVFIFPRKKRRTENDRAADINVARTTARLKAEVEARKAAVRDPTMWAMPGMPDWQANRIREGGP